MATPYALTPEWTATNRYDVSVTGPVSVGNTGGMDVRWARTADQSHPASDPLQSSLLRPGQNITLALKAGESLWLAARPSGTAIVDAAG